MTEENPSRKPWVTFPWELQKINLSPVGSSPIEIRKSLNLSNAHHAVYLPTTFAERVKPLVTFDRVWSISITQTFSPNLFSVKDTSSQRIFSHLPLAILCCRGIRYNTSTPVYAAPLFCRVTRCLCVCLCWDIRWFAYTEPDFGIGLLRMPL